MDQQELSNRRPLAVRETSFAIGTARWLAKQRVTPNQISVLSVVFAALACIAFFACAAVEGNTGLWFLVLAALFIQARLLCNLFDGMVAMEGGKKTASGELFNDIPDRIADPLILIGAGYSVAVIPYAEVLGWAAAVLAVITAYIRVLGVSLGAPADFRGPMAKQHRMAALTIACILSLVEPLFALQGQVMLVCLAVIVVGCVITVYRRTQGIYRFLEASV